MLELDSSIYTYSFPEGIYNCPHLTVIKGHFKGLTIRLNHSYVLSISEQDKEPKNKLSFSFTVLKKGSNNYRQNSINRFIPRLVYSFLARFNKEQHNDTTIKRPNIIK